MLVYWRSRHARWSFLLALAATLCVLVSPARADGATNFAVGDSITNQSRDEILTQFYSAAWPGGVFGVNSQRIDQMRPYLQFIAAATPGLRRTFIYLGTNDAWQWQNRQFQLSRSVNELRAAVHDVIDVRPKACVYLVTLKEWRFPTAPRYTEAAVTLNRHMRSIDAAFSKVHLIDWNAITASHDGGRGEDQWFSDFIGHLNQSGQNRLAAVYRWVGTLTNNCGPAPPG